MIFTVTLNPAIDKILFLEAFQRSRTNRLTRTLETIGGKGTHVSIALKLLGSPSTALGVSLGENGRKIARTLEAWGVQVRFNHYDLPGMESRTNYELVENSGHTCSMLTEKGPLLPAAITDDLLQQLRALLQTGDVLVLTGDASNVEDTCIYSKLTRAAKELGARVFLDASGPYLQEGLNSAPYLIKPNYEELCFLAGRELSTQAEIVSAMQALDPFDLPMIAMTWGGNGAIVKYDQEFYRIGPVKVQAVNEGGCGDVFLAGIIAGMEQGLGIQATLRRAAAVAAAAAESDITAGFDPLRAGGLLDQVVVTEIQSTQESRKEIAS